MKRLGKFGAALLAAVLATGMAFADNGVAGRGDTAIEAAVAQQLQKKSQFSAVRFSVDEGIVTLRGSVDSFKTKLDAEKAARKADHVAGVRNLLAVGGPTVADAEVQEKLARKLRYEGAGFHTNVFNAFAVGVKDGIVTLEGEAYSPYDKQLALDDVIRMPGVKGVVDRVKVSPVSNFDDEIRLRLVRAIYGSSAGFRYGLDPQAPIRIVVNNGHVGLYGVVDSEVDRVMAGMRARSVFGVFDVENHLLTPKDVAR